MSLNKYLKKICFSIEEIDNDSFERIYSTILNVIKNKGNIIFAGNGGSYANSSHIAGDYQNCFSHLGVSSISIGDNFCSVSAIANDLEYDEAISQLTIPLIKPNVDNLIFLFSGSGNSNNVINVAKSLLELDSKIYKVHTVSITSYGGGKLPTFCNDSIAFSVEDMEVAEDLQMILFHYFKQRLIKELPKKKYKSLKYDERVDKKRKV